MAARISLTPAVTAERHTKSSSMRWANSRARVVFPVPGGPQKIIECGIPCLSACHKGFPGANKCVWPTKASKVVGRRRAAKGA